MVNVAIVEFIVVTAILYKTYNKRQSAYGAMRTHGRWKFFTIISYIIYDVYRLSAAPSSTLQIFFSLLPTPYTVFTRFLYAMWGERILYMYILHRRIYHGRVHTGAGRRRRRGRRRGLRKQLHGLFARYVSYFERVAYFYCVTTMYIMYIYARYTRVWWILYTFFFLLTCDESQPTVRVYRIRTYVRTVRTRRSTIIIVTLRCW